MLEIGEWWLALEAVGLATLPICAWLFSGLRDQGYAISKVMGLLLVTLLAWGVSFFSNVTWPAIALCVALLGAASALLLLRGRVSIDWRRLLRMEVVFTAVFLLFVLLRAFSPDYNPYGEKFMDFGMTRALQRDATWPPYDPWFAAESQHYYYFGYFVVSNLATLSGVHLSVGVNLAVATLAALTFTACFGLGYNATGKYRFGLLCAVCVVLLANLFGFFQYTAAPVINLYTPLYGPVHDLLVSYDPMHPWSIPGLHLDGYPGYIDFNSALVSPLNPGGPRNLMGFVDDSVLSFGHFSYWTSSRIIPNTINEFPLFSFLHADMHAHVINIPFQLTALYFAASFLLSKGRPRWAAVGLLGLLVGMMYGVNSWEFPTYAAVSLGAIAVAHANHARATGGRLARKLKVELAPFALRAGLFCGLALAAMLPFFLLFGSGRGLGVVEDRTSMVFFLVIYGFFLTILYSFLLRLCGLRLRTVAAGMAWLGLVGGLALSAYGGGGGSDVQSLVLLGLAFAVLAGGVAAIWIRGVEHPWSLLAGCLWGLAAVCSFLFGFDLFFLLVPLCLLAAASLLRDADRAHQVTSLLILAGAAVALGCEVFYVQDAMASRMNTVFKMYIQVWVLWGIAAGLALYDFRDWFSRRARLSRRAWAAVALALLFMCSMYVLPATVHRSHGFSLNLPTMEGHTISPTLDGTAYIREVWPEEYAAIQFLDVLPGRPVLLEASGDPYSYTSPVATFTGLPTVVGWGFHEMNWRANYSLVSERIDQCRVMYSDDNLSARLDLMRRYDVEYVYVGHLEEDRYGEDVYARFDAYPQAFRPVLDVAVAWVYADPWYLNLVVDNLTHTVLEARAQGSPDTQVAVVDGDLSGGTATLTVTGADGTPVTVSVTVEPASWLRRAVVYELVG